MTHDINVSLSAYQQTKTIGDILHPPIAPFDEGYLSVSSLHRLWFAQYGNPTGLPVVVLHGGPGGRCSDRDMRYFDPNFYRIILIDQRGAGRSQPNAETRDNNTGNLIADLELLRNHVDVERWLVFGGSWGSALALAYGEAHPSRCLGFILRGIFLGTKDEYQKLWCSMGDIYPEAYHDYVEFLPPAEREDLLESYYQRLMSDNPSIHMPAARAFYRYDQICATLFDKSRLIEELKDDHHVLALSRLFAHYSKHAFFLDADQLMRNLSHILHLPARIVHGRYDVICRVQSAFRLHRAWPVSKLTIVQDAGHAAFEPGITEALVHAAEDFKRDLKS